MTKLRLFISIFTCLILALVPFAGAASAQANVLQISPTKQTVDVAPGGSKTIKISYKNVQTTDKTIYLFYENFTSSDDESGAPKLTNEPISFGASNFMFGVKTFMLPASFTSEQNVNIEVPANTPAGTYYGAVRASDSNNRASASVASLLFVNVGKIAQTADIASFKLTGGQYEVRVKNTGNGFITPDITVSLLDANGTELEKMDINTDKAGVLSNSVRKYTAKSAESLAPDGTYTAKVSVSPDNGTTILNNEFSIGPPATVEESADEPQTETVSNNANDTKNDENQNNRNLPYIIAGSALGLVLLAGLLYLLIKKLKKRRQIKKGPLGTVDIPAGHVLHHQTVVHTTDTYHPEDQTTAVNENTSSEEASNEPNNQPSAPEETNQTSAPLVPDDDSQPPEADKPTPGAPPAP